MKNHDIFELQNNLHKIASKIDALATFHKSHDDVRQCLEALARKQTEKPSRVAVIDHFVGALDRFLKNEWARISHNETLAALDGIEDLKIEFKGFDNPSCTQWTDNTHDITIELSFHDYQMRAKAGLGVSLLDSAESHKILGVTYIEINHTSLVDTLRREHDCDDNALALYMEHAASFTEAVESLINDYVMLVGRKDCSNYVDIPFNRFILDEIECKSAVDSVSTDTIKATTQDRKVIPLEDRLTNQISKLRSKESFVHVEDVYRAIQGVTM